MTAHTPSRLWRNARLATMVAGTNPLGRIEDGVVAARDGHIVYAGPAAGLGAFDAEETIDCGGRWITPGLIDCHTHLVHAGNRAREFEMRLKGASYEEIAKAGGGIISSLRAFRAADEAALIAETLPRLDALIAEGVTTVEIKSGYGLDLSNEIKALRAARRLAEKRPVSVTTSFLGAHAVPPEFKDDRAGYVAHVVEDMLSEIARLGLADAVDAFHETIAFSAEEVDRVFTRARALGLPVKLHADQLHDNGGAALAARHGALSADHIEHASADGIAAMAAAGTVAVLLPGAFYFIHETKKPAVDDMRKAGVPIAIATDNNPGTSPLTSLLLTMNMAATLFGLSVDECLTGVTREAARALGRLGEIGTLEPGKWADLAIWDIEEPAELVYRIGFNPLHGRVWRGNI
ncbi:imidazolonepropionase [Consotaella salsifontis]|uniref:Imidazolonepropionase n=1 Tax=Consotaella salsifontis TaxID=1365950 RepID=A0A1T4SNQ0_9HYPH|nr:imidazolonepropionase [Consotaella salsifontis]SKA29825.1 imidazolonepropionase [Consotaella salsifontis]